MAQIIITSVQEWKWGILPQVGELAIWKNMIDHITHLLTLSISIIHTKGINGMEYCY